MVIFLKTLNWRQVKRQVRGNFHWLGGGHVNLIDCDAVDNSDYYKLLGEILESINADDWSDTEWIGLWPLVRQSINTFHLTPFLGFCQLPTLECVPIKRKRQTGPPFFASCEELFVEFESSLFRLKNDFFFF